MDEKTALASLVKKRVKQFTKPFRPLRNSRDSEGPLDEIRSGAGRLCELFSLFESHSSNRVYTGVSQSLNSLSNALGEVRNWDAAHGLMSRFVKEERDIKSRQSITLILKEIEKLREAKTAVAHRQLKGINSKKIGKALAGGFETDGPNSFAAWVKMLDEKRERLFNQVVEMIRSAQKEEFDALRLETDRFCYLLEVAVEAGYQKGKRLLQVLRLLSERLQAVSDEEVFRELIQNLEKERANDAEKVADVQRLRTLQNRLGTLQARTLQNLHDHLPVSLQLLKRRIVWAKV